MAVEDKILISNGYDPESQALDDGLAINIADLSEEALSEVLPVEFLESSYFAIADSEIEDEQQQQENKSAAAGDAFKRSSSNMDTVLMRPSEVRRMGGGKLSSRRSPAAPSNPSRRTKRLTEDDLTPEEIEYRRKRDAQAKLIIYGIIALVTLLFAALVTYKLPIFFPETFPGGLWPWNAITDDYAGY